MEVPVVAFATTAAAVVATCDCVCVECRHKRVLSDIIADSGRPIRLRYCNAGPASAREEELPCVLDIQQAVELIQEAAGAAQASGALHCCHLSCE